MSKNNTGGSAFPSLNSEMTGIDSDGNERFSVEPSGGMTLRDYFAAKAMSAIILDRVLFNDYDNAKEWLQKTAKASYEFADAMIVERAK